MTTDATPDPTVQAVADLVRQARRLYAQWRVGIFDDADEIARVRPDVPAPVLRLVRELIAADKAAG